MDNANLSVLTFSSHKVNFPYVQFNPINPNQAVSARAVFPQSGHIRPENSIFSSKFSKFFQIRIHLKVRTAHRRPIHQLKTHEKPYQRQKKYFSSDK